MSSRYRDIPILLYHEVGTGVWSITPKKFAQKMAQLSSAGYKTISMSELWQGIKEDKTTDQKLVVITFDDGREGVCINALPILAQHGFTATLYIITERVGTSLADWKGMRPIDSRVIESDYYATWKQLGDSLVAGHELGSHTHQHLPLAKLSDAEIEDQISTAKEVFRQELDHDARHFAYPFGSVNTTAADLVGRYHLTGVTTVPNYGGLSRLGRFDGEHFV